MKFGFIGYGSIAKKHIQAIFSLYPNASILLVRHKPSAPDNETPGCTTARDFDELRNVDAICITNPTSLHVNTIQKVLAFKKPLFIEKPLSHNMTGLSDLVKSINASGLINYVACNMRFHSCMEYLKEKLLPGLRINEANSYCGSFLPDWRAGIDFRSSYSAHKSMGGGVHLDLIHEIDYCYYLFGAPKKQFKTLTNKSNLGIDAVDFAHYHWQYESFSAQITLNYFRKDYKRTLEIVAEDATYLVDFKSCTVSRGDEVIFTGDQGVEGMYQRQMKYFVEQVQANRACSNDIKEAYHVLNLCINES